MLIVSACAAAPPPVSNGAVVDYGSLVAGLRAAGATIEPLPVERLQAGMTVWTADGAGNRTSGIILKKTTTPAPPSFQVVRITLDDGRAITASAGHPTAEGRPLGDYRVDDRLDGAVVTTVQYLPYDSYTWDILPSGDTGLYWANGVRLKSTLAAK